MKAGLGLLSGQNFRISFLEKSTNFLGKVGVLFVCTDILKPFGCAQEKPREAEDAVAEGCLRDTDVNAPQAGLGPRGLGRSLPCHPLLEVMLRLSAG